jgi:hypothetical protein
VVPGRRSVPAATIANPGLSGYFRSHLWVLSLLTSELQWYVFWNPSLLLPDQKPEWKRMEKSEKEKNTGYGSSFDHFYKSG